jgi:two-component system, NarL family, nitrate/nitrite response regulator NarL
MPRLLIVDDHPLFRSGVVSALRDAMDLEEIAEAGSLREALARLEAERYDLAVVDIGLPDGSGLEIVELEAGKPSAPRFFILSMNVDRASVRKALRMGACGYSSKGISLGHLVLALKLVLGGELFVEGEILKELLAVTLREREDCPELLARLASLTPREREFLDALLGGQTAKEMALGFGVSHRTAENYQSAVYAKLGARSPVELVRLAQRMGLMLSP